MSGLDSNSFPLALCVENNGVMIPMKKYFFRIVIVWVLGLSAHYGYSENPSAESAQQINAKSTTQQSPMMGLEQPSNPPKNYFDIKVEDKENDRFLSEFINMMTTLGIIVVIILIATWFLKKMVNSRIQQLNTSSYIKIVERRTLTPKTSLYLLDIHGKGFIVAESTNGVTSLGSFDVNEIEKNQPVSFSDVMEKK